MTDTRTLRDVNTGQVKSETADHEVQPVTHRDLRVGVTA